ADAGDAGPARPRPRHQVAPREPVRRPARHAARRLLHRRRRHPRRLPRAVAALRGALRARHLAGAAQGELSLQRVVDPAGDWEMVRRAPAAELRDVVVGGYCGWRERATPPPVRRELPGTRIPIILNLGARYRVGDPGATLAGAAVHDSFVAGLYESFAETQACGPTEGVQVDLSPLGAYRLLGPQSVELTGRGVGLAEVLGVPAARALLGRLAEAP